MYANQNRKRILMAVLVGASLMLASCQQVWHVVGYGFKGHPPIFCVSSEENCTGDFKPYISFYAIDKNGFQRPVWEIVARNAKDVKFFMYGVVPDGWHEEKQAEFLKPNQTYMIFSGSYYFQVDKDNRLIPGEWDYEAKKFIPKP